MTNTDINKDNYRDINVSSENEDYIKSGKLKYNNELERAINLLREKQVHKLTSNKIELLLFKHLPASLSYQQIMNYKENIIGNGENWHKCPTQGITYQSGGILGLMDWILDHSEEMAGSELQCAF